MKLRERIRGYFGIDPDAFVQADVLAEAETLLARGPLTHDLCAECHTPLHVNDRVEVLVGTIEADDEYGGSSALLVTYCKDCHEA